ncbi:hypothetical protein [Streptomyces sp. NPDC053560]|uniref:hypothetical protein n=1 Tax=Streptomyces sp. NPDC053560 TaxID=3365711 RepID=UPI0037D4DEB0
MSNSLSRYAGFDIEVDDKGALRLSPESIPAQPLISGPRLAVVGRIGPRYTCSNCRDFKSVVTRNGVVYCDNPVHNQDKPQLPMRPTPHERDGREPVSEPGRSHPRQTALLAR